MRTIEQLASAAGFDVEPDLRKPDGTPYIVGPGSHAENCATQLARFAALVAEQIAAKFEEHANELPHRTTWPGQKGPSRPQMEVMVSSFETAAYGAREMFPMPKP